MAPNPPAIPEPPLAGPQRFQWEYRVEDGMMNRRVDLASIGREGWELVSVVVAEGMRELYFKRPRRPLRTEASKP
jgi:hypothetical protein